jgi:ectoine hydroxylase-related dioxygenase (phytanoyl-CoA dioxygenase family)
MNITISAYKKKKFKKTGYIKYQKFLTKNFVNKLVLEIENSKDTIKYYDNSNNLRRIEKIYDKGFQLKLLNKKISEFLYNFLNKKFLIFKDKFNIKYPGGEGFFAHYDGVFEFINSNNEKKKGWYEYGDFFISALVAIDECNMKNGALEIAKSHKGNFEQLFVNTKKDGTPALSAKVESKTIFNLINLDVGDMVVFSNTCPHRSKRNNSQKVRRIIYYTYSLGENGSKYKEYFDDKENSKNKSKALSER